jgi:hypothetical protein
MSLSPIIKTDDIGFMQVRKDYRKQAYYYTVITASKVKKIGVVKTGSINWTCYGNGCFAVLSGGGAKKPSIGMCQTLAKQVGPIIQYGHTERKLNPEQLGTCNRR